MKKFASLLLAVLMVCTMIPFATITAFAEDGEQYVFDVIRFNQNTTATSEKGHYELSAGKYYEESGWVVNSYSTLTIRSKDGQMITDIEAEVKTPCPRSLFSFSSGTPRWDGNTLTVTGINADEFSCTSTKADLYIMNIKFMHKHAFSNNRDCSCGVPREGTDIIRFNNNSTATSENGLFELSGGYVAYNSGWEICLEHPLLIRAKSGQKITRLDFKLERKSNVGDLHSSPNSLVKVDGRIVNANTKVGVNTTVSVTDFNSSEITLEFYHNGGPIIKDITVYYTTPKDMTEYRCFDVGEGAYIDTGFIPTSDTRVVMEAEVEKTPKGAAVFGVGYNAEGSNYSFHVNSTDSEYGAGFGQNMSWSDAKLQDRCQTIELSKELLKVDEVAAQYSGNMDGSCTFNHTKNGGLPMYLFAINFFGGEVQTLEGQSIRFYSCKIYEKDELKFDFTPAKKIDPVQKTDVFGLYDSKNNKFYEIKGNGTVKAYLEKDKWEGKGTAADPCQISNAGQLTELAKNVADGIQYDGICFKLTKDLEYSGQPIGSEGHPFKGVFDGDCHKLTLKINTGKTGAALFYETDGATIKDLEIAGSVSGKDCVGGIVGHAYGNTLIDNCHVTASVKGTEVNIGGVVGMLFDSTVSNCRVDATVEGGWTNVGGIVGWLHNNSKVVNCVKTGETIGTQSPETAKESVGGIVGSASGGDSVIANCASIGKITAFNNGGGIIGSIEDNVRTFRLYCCYVNNEMKVRKVWGLICGYNHNNRDDASYREKVEGTDILTVFAEQFYHHKCENEFQGQYFPASTAVKATNRSEIVNTLNTYVENNRNIVPSVALSMWSEVGDDILPESCKGFSVSNDQQNGTSGIGSVLSDGSIWIIVVIAVVALGGVAALVIVKKKKKPALASGDNKDEE